ncbi:MAG: rhomboid family intramembrane serine protease [Salinivirgaceae bacterium]|nr:rhomboid family intramembrane serine protease [Salinivirgaceae bacterium]
MNEKRKIFHAILFPLLFLFGMWISFGAFAFLNADMGLIGVKPQELNGIAGIFLSPFAHGSLSHITSNSISFIALGTALFYFYRLIAYRVFLINWLVSGVLLWIGGRESTHIGASGLIYGLAFFIFFSGLFRKDKQLGAISMIVVFLYGSMLWGVLPQGGNISWEGHLFGAISGLTLAWYYRKNPINFIPEEDGSSVSVTWGRGSEFEYHYIEDEQDEDSEMNP